MLPKVRLLPVVVIGLLLSAIVLAMTTAQTHANGPVEIEFWHAMSRSRGKKLDELVAKFNAKNPGIVVKANFIKSADPKHGNNYNALYSKILEHIAKGTPPDVSQVYENWTTQLVDIDALTPVDSFFAGANGMDAKSLNDIVPTFKNANTFNFNGQNRVCTLPFNKSIYVLYYNKAIFRELGLTPPTTWEALRKCAKTVADKKNMAGLAFLPSVDIFGHYLYAHGGEFIKEQRAAFGGQIGVKDMNFWVNIVHQDRSSAPTAEAADWFEKGQAAMYIETTSKIGGFKKNKNLDFGVMPIPRGTTSACQFAGTNLAIFSKSSPEKQQAAWSFVRYMCSPEVTTEWAMGTGYLPVRTSAINSVAYKHYIDENPEYQVGITSLKYATVQPRVPAWESIRGILDDAMYEALSCKYSSADVVVKAESLSNDLLENVSGEHAKAQ